MIKAYKAPLELIIGCPIPEKYLVKILETAKKTEPIDRIKRGNKELTNSVP